MHVNVQEGERVRAGEPLMDGPTNPHDILNVLGEKALQAYLVNEIQEVYRLQGVNINDKHIETIARQMMRWVKIEDVGDTEFLVDEQMDKFRFLEENERVIAAGGRPAQGRPLLLGITKASLSTDSFISAASFQETTRVLTEASISGKVDHLRGLKENVTMGRLIPAGTGFEYYRHVQIAGEDIEEEMVTEPEAVPLDVIPGYDEETRALYAGGSHRRRATGPRRNLSRVAQRRKQSARWRSSPSRLFYRPPTTGTAPPLSSIPRPVRRAELYDLRLDTPDPLARTFPRLPDSCRIESRAPPNMPRPAPSSRYPPAAESGTPEYRPGTASESYWPLRRRRRQRSALPAVRLHRFHQIARLIGDAFNRRTHHARCIGTGGNAAQNAARVGIPVRRSKADKSRDK